MNNNIVEIEKYVKNFAQYTALKGVVGENNFLILLLIGFFVIPFDLFAILAHQVIMDSVFAIISLVCLIVSIFCFVKKRHYEWFLYRFTNTVSLEFGIVASALTLFFNEYENVPKAYVIVLVLYGIFSSVLISSSIRHTKNKIKNIDTVKNF